MRILYKIGSPIILSPVETSKSDMLILFSSERWDATVVKKAVERLSLDERHRKEIRTSIVANDKTRCAGRNCNVVNFIMRWPTAVWAAERFFTCYCAKVEPRRGSPLCEAQPTPSDLRQQRPNIAGPPLRISIRCRNHLHHYCGLRWAFYRYGEWLWGPSDEFRSLSRIYTSRFLFSFLILSPVDDFPRRWII